MFPQPTCLQMGTMRLTNMALIFIHIQLDINISLKHLVKLLLPNLLFHVLIGLLVACHTPLCRSVGWSVGWSVGGLVSFLLFWHFWAFWAYGTCPDALLTFSSTAPAHPHKTRVVVYPAFSFDKGHFYVSEIHSFFVLFLIFFLCTFEKYPKKICPLIC